MRDPLRPTGVDQGMAKSNSGFLTLLLIGRSHFLPFGIMQDGRIDKAWNGTFGKFDLSSDIEKTMGFPLDSVQGFAGGNGGAHVFYLAGRQRLF